MDTQQTLAHEDYSAKVDTSRPFRSVKEAIAVFGERLFFREIYPTQPISTYNDNNPSNNNKEIITSSWKYPSPSPSPTTQQNPKKDDDDVERYELCDMLKKLEAEVEETKTELKLLKEKESETEIALATLNAEVHNSMLKLAEAEAVAAVRKAETVTRTLASIDIYKEKKEEERLKREMIIRMENSTTLGEILGIGIGENGKYHEGKIKERRVKKMKMKMKKKKKPIVHLVSEFFFKKKGASSTTLQNLLHASSNN